MTRTHHLLSWIGMMGVIVLILAGCAAQPVVFGFSGEITGNGSDLGISARNGMMLGVEYVNTNGGINGRELQVIIKDDQGKPEVAKQVDGELIDAGVVAILGHITSEQSVAGLTVTQPAGMVMLSPISSSLALTGVDDLFFRVCADNMREIRVLTRQMLEQGQPRIVIIYDAENQAFSLPYAQAVAAQLNLLGGEALDLFPYASTDTNLDQMVANTATLKPDAVLIVSSAVKTALLIQHFRLGEFEPALYATDWAFSETLLQTGGKAVEGVSLMASFDINGDSAEMKAFQEKYQARYGYSPNYAAMQTYEAVLVLAEALRQTKGTSDGLPEALGNIRDLQGLNSTISMDEFGDVVRPVYLFQVQDGKMVTVQEFNGD